MHKSVGTSLHKFLSVLLVVLLAFTAPAYAQEGGKEGESMYHKLEPFTVNLVGMTQVVQVVVTLKLASPEIDPKVSLYLPAIRNQMILLLSSKTAEDLQTVEGKSKLIAESKVAVNKALETKPQSGVTDVLFESIIIQ